METCSLTYDELSVALNRTPDATRQLVRRRRWKRTVGNDGKTRVSVPVEELAEARNPDVPAPTPHVEAPTLLAHSPDVAPGTLPVASEDARALIAYLEEHVAELGARAVRLENEVEILRPRAAHADVLTAQLEGERQRVAEMVERANEMRAERDKLLERALERPAPSPATGIIARFRQALVGLGRIETSFNAPGLPPTSVSRCYGLVFP